PRALDRCLERGKLGWGGDGALESSQRLVALTEGEQCLAAPRQCRRVSGIHGKRPIEAGRRFASVLACEGGITQSSFRRVEPGLLPVERATGSQATCMFRIVWLIESI